MKRTRRAVAVVLLAALATAPTRYARANESDEPFEHRGIRRAGISLFAIGVSALPSSLAFYATTHGKMGLEAAGMVVTGHVLMAFGIPMWVYGAQGRRTHPRNAAVMYTGMLVAGLGLVALPPGGAAFAASFEPGIDHDTETDRRVAAVAIGAAAHVLIAAGIPMWAWGAASPDDYRAGTDARPQGTALTIEPFPFGVRGRF